ncbi:MAG: allantoate amidohydrolase [Ktedonobacteraceae bacterium]
MDIQTSARTIMERCERLGQYSEEPGLLVRRYATPAMQQVNKLVASWMQAAGMSTHQDQVGNLRGRYPAAQEQAQTLLLGSHLDTVRDAGKYDGPLGVLLALSVIERLYKRGERLPFAIELCAFADEEGLRYASAYLGSKAVVGTFEPELLDLLDSDGIPLAEAMRTFGGEPEQIALARREGRDLLGYCEVHIEQGPVLESLNLPVGVVSAITGHSRIKVTLSGMAGHAGTVPMSLRRDALCAAAACVLAIESYAQSISDLVATVGQFSIEPGASNVIPGRVTFSLDVRHQEDAVRVRACAEIEKRVSEIARTRSIAYIWSLLQENCAIRCTLHLADVLEQAIAQAGIPVHTMTSGAGHDAVVLSELTAVAMLFVRCRGGISHNPTEAVTQEDVAVTIDVLERFLHLLVQTGEQS